MKKPLSIIFLFLLFLKVGGFFGILCIEQEIVREEMVEKIASKLEKSELQNFTFSKTEYYDLDWEREGKEFWYKNKMYDVVNTQQNADKMIVSCISDSKETEIEMQLADIGRLENESIPLKNNSKALVTMVFQKYLIPENYIFNNIFANKIEITPFENYLNFFNSESLKVNFRPPIIS